MAGGLLPSATQCTTLPLSSFASNCKKQWGLAQNHSVTVPFMVTRLSESKAAFPWCAQTGATNTRMRKAQVTRFTSLAFIISSTKTPSFKPNLTHKQAPHRSLFRIQPGRGIGKFLVVFLGLDRRTFHLTNIETRRLQAQW